jgi:hypothetical protein
MSDETGQLLLASVYVLILGQVTAPPPPHPRMLQTYLAAVPHLTYLNFIYDTGYVLSPTYAPQG